VVGLLLGLPPVAGFLFAIGVSVALVPEGLLPTVTLSLAVGAQRMARRHALVRRLEAVETLGATTFICTDKTGTLTHNQMEVLEVWTPTGSASISGEGYEPNAEIEATPEARPALHELALVAGRCSRGRAVQRDGAWVPEGDPMEAALDVLARRLGIDVAADELRTPVTRRFPFDPRRRRMSLVADGRLLMKGAPEVVLPLCRNQDGAMDAADQMAHRGLRVLAVAARRVSDSSAASDTMEELERDLDMLGLVGLEDPPRANAAAALAACRGAGIRVAMITGDHPGTAAAIARQVSLLCETSRVIDGRDLPSNDCDLAALLDADGTIVSRVAPEDKLRIARALRTRGHVVAMTGDGVNDGPALHEADIGVAMGRSGTDVAREAADLVLLDDDFSTIVAAIEQGRATFGNLRRCLTYHLTDNVAELTPFVVWALSGGTIPLALGVLQILFLDVGTDQLPALGLGIEPPGPHVLQQPPSGRHLLDAPLLRRVFGLLGPTEALVEMVAFGAVLLMGGWRLGETPSPELLAAASGAAFATVVFGQAANAMACRSASRWPGSLGWTRNRFLVASIGVEFLLLLGFLFIPTIAHLLGQAPPPAQGWLIAALAVPAVLLVDAAHKRLRGPRTGQTHSHPRG
jgi:calcium-translocating P-type ATPase